MPFQLPFHIRLIRLILGLFLYALAIAITIQANIGYMPWDVLGVGFSKTAHISVGLSSILIGAIIILISIFLGEIIGLGTILNMLLIGSFLDIILFINFIPKMTEFWSGLIMMLFGLLVCAFASYFYITTAFGTGPRDGLMIAISRKSGYAIGLCRSALEIFAASFGYILGGLLGLGTIIATIALGFMIQLVFTLLILTQGKLNMKA